MSNVVAGKDAGHNLTTGVENVLMGPGCDCDPKVNRCIVIGKDMYAEHNYQLLVGTPGKILINWHMKHTDWEPLYKAFSEMVAPFKLLTDLLPGTPDMIITAMLGQIPTPERYLKNEIDNTIKDIEETLNAKV